MAEFKHIIRVSNTDLKGEKPAVAALTKIKGVGTNFASVLCKLSNISLTKKVGNFTDEEVQKINTILADPKKAGIPKWFLNRQKDNETGENKHLINNDLIFTKDQDLKQMKKIKSYRGVRHMFHLPTRGQRTRSNFRPNKGKVTGVKRKGKASKTGK
jgi:small subunit ribosomal protein S13